MIEVVKKVRFEYPIEYPLFKVLITTIFVVHIKTMP